MRKILLIALPIFAAVFILLMITQNNAVNYLGGTLGGMAMNTNKNNVGLKYVTIETDKGTIKAELYVLKAPITTKNFIDLAGSGFYNGLTFHRVEPGFVVQGGDPNGDDTGGSEKSIPLEINPELRHVKGALGMARTNDPNSATSQFYITLGEAYFLDDNYAVFGKVVSGMDAAEKLRVGDKMNKVTISDN